MIAVFGGDNIKDKYDDTDFNPIDGKTNTSYAKSKIHAEKCIIDFRKKIPAESHLEIMTIHPGFIVGNKSINNFYYNLKL